MSLQVNGQEVSNRRPLASQVIILNILNIIFSKGDIQVPVIELVSNYPKNQLNLG